MFYAAEGGGVSSYLNAKARWLARRSRIRHTIVSPSIRGDGGNPDVVQIPGITFPGIDGYRMPRSIGATCRILQDLQPDLIEVGDAGPCAWAALRMKRRQQIPVVAFYHSDLPALIGRQFGKLGQQGAIKYLQYIYRQCDLVLAPSHMMVQQLAAMGLPAAVHQPLGVDTWMFCPQRRDATLRAQLRLPANTRLLVYAGRFTPEKKLHFLIEAVRKLGKAYHLVLIGSGEELPRCRQTTFIPFVRDTRLLAELLASCDVLVHPGDCETFGLIILEAMACGLPVVGTTGGGVGELVDEQTGVLVAPNSAASLCEGIEAIFQRDLARLGANARRKATSEYDWDRIMPQLLHRYAGLLATHQRAELEAGIAYVAK
ncbi:glycosyltransferase family 1 protein [Noviherbaspirillum sedimenti]|uniref:Glycosyltransferase family 1 protein n=2 Tax=Noviherbaspirillum sedimenti TaxID=2320865 RepID=A0A3A3G8C2_9BURK|nr:glycosyltransferase family 1 protein [Noviherbaspirillum sedimenti]